MEAKFKPGSSLQGVLGAKQMAPLGDSFMLCAEMEKSVGSGGHVTAASCPN